MSKLEHRLITSRGDYHEALREAFADVAAAGCRELWLCDDSFADWPLNERQVIEHLTLWAQAHRKLTLIARHFDEFPRRHARWLVWRQKWSHVVECRAVDEADAADVPTVFLAPGVVTVRLVDPVRYRGSVSHDLVDSVASRELIDAILQRSSEALPATTLGL